MLDKKAYKITVDGKELPKIVNENLLKKYYGWSYYEPMIIIKSDINRKAYWGWNSKNKYVNNRTNIEKNIKKR